MSREGYISSSLSAARYRNRSSPVSHIPSLNPFRVPVHVAVMDTLPIAPRPSERGKVFRLLLLLDTQHSPPPFFSLFPLHSLETLPAPSGQKLTLCTVELPPSLELEMDEGYITTYKEHEEVKYAPLT